MQPLLNAGKCCGTGHDRHGAFRAAGQAQDRCVRCAGPAGQVSDVVFPSR
jgi:hypothetical protein